VKISAISYCLVAALFAVFFSTTLFERSVAAQESKTLPPIGGGEYKFAPSDEISAEYREWVKAQIAANIARLESEGKLPPARPDLVLLSHPLRPAPGANVFHVDTISNYVDHDQRFPNLIRDWNCGTRTYDTSSGYNHQGTDYSLWPFGQQMQANNTAEIVAAAEGTIVFKSDGNPDQNCSVNSNNWNAVYIRHIDNSVAWYGHMKSGSLTPKAVGDTVARGEKIGIVGSSGGSTGPHLHLELYNALNQLQDPFAGVCNSMNLLSWWVQQEPYRVTRLNALKTHSAMPVIPPCPGLEVTNEKTVFAPGETIYSIPYFRDEVQGMNSQFSILRPDGTVFQSWTHNSPQTLSSSYWAWGWQLPANAPTGTWKLRGVVNGTTYETNFVVAAGGALPTISGVVTYGTVPAGQPARFVPGVLLTASGSVPVNATTNAAGAYSLSGFGSGSYTVTPSKSGDVNGSISGLDAARVAQHVAGLITLTPNQQIAGDATNNGALSGLDAARIAQFAAGLSNPGIAGTWKFVPPSRTYPSVTVSQTNQNYEAILVGDVTGNWTPAAPRPDAGSAPVLSLFTKHPAYSQVRHGAVDSSMLRVDLPEIGTPARDSELTVPIRIGDTTGKGVLAYDFTIKFDQDVLSPADIPLDSAGTLSEGWTIVQNTRTPGEIRVTAFSMFEMSGKGTLVNLRFRTVGGSSKDGQLRLTALELNEGEVPVRVVDRLFTGLLRTLRLPSTPSAWNFRYQSELVWR
jgi:murein DD-endopeptidase MepM/ murein hydrolase activator NlpD